MTSTLTITALEAVRSGQCTAACLIAGESSCTCRCGGAFHGAVADAEIAAVPPKPALCGVPAPAPGGFPELVPGVHCELEAGHPPMPARYLHHNGTFGSWLQDVEPAPQLFLPEYRVPAPGPEVARRGIELVRAALAEAKAARRRRGGP